MCAILKSIQALLSAPNPDDPLSENIAKHWKSNEAEAVETGDVILTLNLTCYNTPCTLVFFVIVMLVSHILVNYICAAKEWTRLYASGA